jgi:hypothetical protein
LGETGPALATIAVEDLHRTIFHQAHHHTQTRLACLEQRQQEGHALSQQAPEHPAAGEVVYNSTADVAAVASVDAASDDAVAAASLSELQQHLEALQQLSDWQRE